MVKNSNIYGKNKIRFSKSELWLIWQRCILRLLIQTVVKDRCRLLGEKVLFKNSLQSQIRLIQNGNPLFLLTYEHHFYQYFFIVWIVMSDKKDFLKTLSCLVFSC